MLLVGPAGCGPGDEAGGPPVCGDGVVDASEQCDDGNRAPGDGCSSTCIPSGMPFDCVDLLEGDFPGESTVVTKLLPLTDGSFLAVGGLDDDPSYHGWIARYGPTGDQLWILDTMSIDPEINVMSDLVGDGSGGAWALGAGDRLLHVDKDGSAGASKTIVAQEGAAVDVAAIEFTAAGVWLSGTLAGDAWLGLYDPASDSVTDLLREDLLGFDDYAYAVERSDAEVAVAATMSTSPNVDVDVPRIATTDILVVMFDLDGNELRRASLGPNADLDFVRFADRLVFDRLSHRWFVGGRYVARNSFAPQVWLAPAEAQPPWQWTQEAWFGDIVSGHEGVIAAINVGSLNDANLRGQLTNVGADQTIRWTFDEVEGGGVSYENFYHRDLARDAEGQLRTAGTLYDGGSRKLRSCLVAE
ncbi:DUF4215 domain-containing protein [Enhygromyxa salina]|uniref:Uncharacterized protein n=1 Tax=Enhygromyxa salina TaxID=215803 RepID=A0A2S9XGC1_9BACT|nr:DUF4215 domain-containing protein [Enhygromyxa salina]PRP91924.1 hypothetical protein ENSA7_81820 [Enhygromyxa salina]